MPLSFLRILNKAEKSVRNKHPNLVYFPPSIVTKYLHAVNVRSLSPQMGPVLKYILRLQLIRQCSKLVTNQFAPCLIFAIHSAVYPSGAPNRNITVILEFITP
jgi:hypothetical protein